MMYLKLTAADKTDVGKQREQNEDYVYKRVESSEEGDMGLFIVADGMGGYQAGEVASRLTVTTISKNLDCLFPSCSVRIQPERTGGPNSELPISEQPTIQIDRASLQAKATAPNNRAQPEANASGSHTTFKDGGQVHSVPIQPLKDGGANALEGALRAENKTHKLAETQSSVAIEDQLRTAIQEANKAIFQYGDRKSSARGLGSTVTAALVRNDQAYIANVGDSRTYLFRDNHLQKLTEDHSLVAKLVESKQITDEEVYTHPQRNLIYRSLGAGHRNVEVDIFHEVLRPGDKLLLCSDGLWEMVHHQDLEELLKEQSNPQVLCDKLITLANMNGGEDNITAIIVDVNKH
jgi:serine/threonine protein phosphatase PrpC